MCPFEPTLSWPTLSISVGSMSFILYALISLPHSLRIFKMRLALFETNHFSTEHIQEDKEHLNKV